MAAGISVGKMNHSYYKDQQEYPELYIRKSLEDYCVCIFKEDFYDTRIWRLIK